MSTETYFCETDERPEQIDAQIQAGLVVPWRVSATGEQWYRRRPPIHGVPPTTTIYSRARETIRSLWGGR